MSGPTVHELIPVLQTAIGPVILVSGVGLLLLTMTNRLGRVIDRARLLGVQQAELTGEHRAAVLAQQRILARRADILRRAITLATVSVLLASLLVITLFVTALLRLEDAWLIATLFTLCMLSLTGGLVEFLRDLNESLSAIRLELGPDFDGRGGQGETSTSGT